MPILHSIRIATPSPSSKRDITRITGVTRPLPFSLASMLAFSITLFNIGV